MNCASDPPASITEDVRSFLAVSIGPAVGRSFAIDRRNDLPPPVPTSCGWLHRDRPRRSAPRWCRLQPWQERRCRGGGPSSRGNKSIRTSRTLGSDPGARKEPTSGTSPLSFHLPPQTPWLWGRQSP